MFKAFHDAAGSVYYETMTVHNVELFFNIAQPKYRQNFFIPMIHFTAHLQYLWKPHDDAYHPAKASSDTFSTAGTTETSSPVKWEGTNQTLGPVIHVRKSKSELMRSVRRIHLVYPVESKESGYLAILEQEGGWGKIGRTGTCDGNEAINRTIERCGRVSERLQASRKDHPNLRSLLPKLITVSVGSRGLDRVPHAGSVDRSMVQHLAVSSMSILDFILSVQPEHIRQHVSSGPFSILRNPAVAGLASTRSSPSISARNKPSRSSPEVLATASSFRPAVPLFTTRNWKIS